MTRTAPPEVGDTHVHERTLTTEDVLAFGELSEDTQPIHTEPDAEGRLVVKGMLTATLPTKIGGEFEVLATRMDHEFRAAVRTGKTITCVWENEAVTEREDRYVLAVTYTCTDEDAREVMTGEIDGIVWKDG